MIKNLNTILISIIGSLIIAKIQPNIVIYAIIIAILILVSINILFGSKDRVKIRMLKQAFFNLPYKVIFEAENISDQPNSLKNSVSMNCLTIPMKKTLFYGERRTCTFNIKGNDRSIEPHKTKVFEAFTTENHKQLFVSKFRRFTIYPNRGRRVRIFSIGPSNREANCFRFYAERFLYQFFKRVPNNKL